MCNSCGGSQRTSTCGCSSGPRNALPIISVNELPTIGRSASNSFYRLPDNTIWYVNKECNGYVKLNYDRDALLKINEQVVDALHRLNCLEQRIGDPYDDSHLVRLIQELQCQLDKLGNTDITRALHVTSLDSAVKRLESKFDKLKSIDADAIQKLAEELKLSIEQNSNNIEGDRADLVALTKRVAGLEEKPDNDTIYDDSELKERVQLNTTAINDLKEGAEEDKQASALLAERVATLEAKEDKDTVYDDTDLRGKVDANTTEVAELKTNVTLTREELTGLVGRIAVVEAKPDNDTVYDDSVIVKQLGDLETATSEGLARLSQLGKDNATQVEEARDDIGKLRERVAILEQKPDQDTLYDDTTVKAEIADIKRILGDVDDDTQFDPTELNNRITALENADTASGASVTALEARVGALEVKPDQDTIYDDAEVRELISTLREDATAERDRLAGRLIELEGKRDVYVSEVEVRQNGNTITLLYNRTDGTSSEVQFTDKDTVTLAYNDEELRRRVEALEVKPDNDTVYDDTEVRRFLNRQRDNITTLTNKVNALEAKPDQDTTYTAGTGITLTGTQFSVDQSVIASKADVARVDGLYTNFNNGLGAVNDEVDGHAVRIAELERQLRELTTQVANAKTLKLYETTTQGAGSIVVNHNLGRLLPSVTLWDVSVPVPQLIKADVLSIDAGTISITLPADYAGPVKVVVIG